MDINERIERILEEMCESGNDWNKFNAKRNEFISACLDAFQSGYRFRKE